jgi:hypothetical protein
MHPDIKETKPRKAGRPVKEINWDIVEKLASIQCTDEEIAAVLGVHSDTIKRRKKIPEYAEVLSNGRAKGRASLRRLQWKAAESGNVTMQIFLGKNLLGQRDKFEEPTESVTDKAREIASALKAMVDTEQAGQ